MTGKCIFSLPLSPKITTKPTAMKKALPTITATLILACTFLLLQTPTCAQQQQYGDLELTVKGNGTQSAIGIPVKAVDQDIGTTTHKTTDENSQAFFEDLYIDTIDDVPEKKEKKIPSLEGMVKIYNISGQPITEKIANNGTVLFKGANQTAAAGIYLAQDQNGNSL